MQSFQQACNTVQQKKNQIVTNPQEALKWYQQQIQTATTHGSSSGSAFGQPSSTGSSFVQRSAFGGTPTSGGGSVFGSQKITGSVFGQSSLVQPNKGGSVFGQANNNTGSVFGQANNNTGSVFGQASINTGSVFGQASSNTGSVFGQASSNTGSVFGQATSVNNNSGSVLGQTTSVNNYTGSIFGQVTFGQNVSGSAFGSKPTSDSLNAFGQQGSSFPASGSVTNTAQNSGSVFRNSSQSQSGNTSQAAGSVFGSSAQSSGSLFTNTVPVFGQGNPTFGSQPSTSMSPLGQVSTGPQTTNTSPFGKAVFGQPESPFGQAASSQQTSGKPNTSGIQPLSDADLSKWMQPDFTFGNIPEEEPPISAR
jgi:hypothetical protein